MAEPLSPAERDRTFCDILNRELVCALGCTEPIAVAYAAALARETLGCEPERLELDCSGNIIKNVKSVTVPNSGGLAGLEAAATLGAVGGICVSVPRRQVVCEYDIPSERVAAGRRGAQGAEQWLKSNGKSPNRC